MGWEDDRAVSEVLGAMLLFGIIVLAIGGYQAFVVPQQNAEIEQKHDLQIQNEFPEIQESISNAVATERHRTASITLGTEYPTRVLSLNPPQVTGTVSTTEPGQITLSGYGNVIQNENFCGVVDNRGSRGIQYEAKYNEHRGTGAYFYENGATFRLIEGRMLLDTEQELVDGNTIRLAPVTTEGIHRSGSASEQLRFQSGKTNYRTIVVDDDDEVKLTLPTRLNEDQWVAVLDDEISDGWITEDDIGVDDGELILTLTPGTFTVECTPVGVGSTPVQDIERNDPEDIADGAINPTSSVKLEAVESSGKTVTMTFEATNEPRTFSEVRVPFHDAFPPGDSGEDAVKSISAGGEVSATDLDIGDSYADLDPDIHVAGPSEVEITFDSSGTIQGSWFVISFLLEDGERAQYFVSVPGGGGTPD